MKKILTGFLLVLMLIPQVSFAATQSAAQIAAETNPQLAALLKQQDADAVTFFQQQAAERAAFIKANPDTIAKLDQYGRALMAYKAAESKHEAVGAPPAVVSDVTYSAFMAKQLAEKQTFLAGQAKARQALGG